MSFRILFRASEGKVERRDSGDAQHDETLQSGGVDQEEIGSGIRGTRKVQGIERLDALEGAQLHKIEIADSAYSARLTLLERRKRRLEAALNF